MRNAIIGALIFAVGVAAGAVPAYFIAKKKYMQQMDEEIQGVRMSYASENKVDIQEYAKQALGEETFVQVQEIIKNAPPKIYQGTKASKEDKEAAKQIKAAAGYFDPEEEAEKLELRPIVPPKDAKKSIEVISPVAFGENEDYSKVELTYYNDGILADDDDDIIDDPDEVVGTEALGSFGEYDDDTVYVRNDILKTYFAINLDLMDYDDIPRPKKPM